MNEWKTITTNITQYHLQACMCSCDVGLKQWMWIDTQSICFSVSAQDERFIWISQQSEIENQVRINGQRGARLSFHRSAQTKRKIDSFIPRLAVSDERQNALVFPHGSAWAREICSVLIRRASLRSTPYKNCSSFRSAAFPQGDSVRPHKTCLSAHTSTHKHTLTLHIHDFTVTWYNVSENQQKLHRESQNERMNRYRAATVLYYSRSHNQWQAYLIQRDQITSKLCVKMKWRVWKYAASHPAWNFAVVMTILCMRINRCDVCVNTLLWKTWGIF